MKKRIYQRLFAVLLVMCLVLSLNVNVKASPNQEQTREDAGKISANTDLQNADEPNLSEGENKAEGQTEGGTVIGKEGAAENQESSVPEQRGLAGAAAMSLDDSGISALADTEKTVTVGESITLSGSSGSDHSWSVTTASGGGNVTLSNTNKQSVTITGVSAGTVTVSHTYKAGYGGRPGGGSATQKTETFTITVQKAGTIEAKVYLRYSNELPSTINAADAAASYGPSGNDVPYITVTVDLDKVLAVSTPATVGSYIYYSIQSDENYTYISNATSTGDKAANKTSAAKFWQDVIYPAIDEGDRTALNAIFGGEGKFIGYVLKKESSGWHIDGVLAEDPPVYVVELYDHTATGQPCLFAISDNNSTRPGVAYDAFKASLEEVLGGENYQYTTAETDKIVVTYLKDGKYYQTTVVPRDNDSHVYPEEDKFDYQTVTSDIYYVSRMKIESTVEVSGTLTLSKIVKGNAANPEQHFTFGLTSEGLTGTYGVTYTGTETGGSIHTADITFTNGEAQLSLADGETATIQGLPAGASVTVKEESGSYTVAAKVNGTEANYTDADGVNVTIAENASVELINTLNQVPQTGFHMDGLPGVVLILCVICAGIFYLLMVKRRGCNRA